jgi:hypothetical protein
MIPDTDLTSQHIEGYARAAIEAGKDGHFSVPLISQIDETLWTGGCINGVKLPDDFVGVVSLYPWEKYSLGPNTVRHEHRLYDSSDVPDIEHLLAIARQVNEFRQQGKTLVHCQAGLNRSGLIAALALILEGVTPAEAIALLREKRCAVVLCNEAFEHLLLGLSL